MPTLTARSVSFLIAVGLILPSSSAAERAAEGKPTAAEDPSRFEFFETHIRPVLVEHCYECHSADADAAMGGLRLDSADALLAGGDSGPSLVPGDARNSLLIRALRQDTLEMPPDGKLPEATIGRFEHWVQMGAPDPRRQGAPAVDEDEPADGKSHWAFQPLRRPIVPPVGDDQRHIAGSDGVPLSGSAGGAAAPFPAPRQAGDHAVHGRRAVAHGYLRLQAAIAKGRRQTGPRQSEAVWLAMEVPPLRRKRPVGFGTVPAVSRPAHG